MAWIFGYCDTGRAEDIKIVKRKWDEDALDESYDVARYTDYVSAVYDNMDKADLIERIKRDGWWYVGGKNKNNDFSPYDIGQIQLWPDE